jgi:hypothetical protein
MPRRYRRIVRDLAYHRPGRTRRQQHFGDDASDWDGYEAEEYPHFEENVVLGHVEPEDDAEDDMRSQLSGDDVRDDHSEQSDDDGVIKENLFHRGGDCDHFDHANPYNPDDYQYEHEGFRPMEVEPKEKNKLVLNKGNAPVEDKKNTPRKLNTATSGPKGDGDKVSEDKAPKDDGGKADSGEIFPLRQYGIPYIALRTRSLICLLTCLVVKRLQ